MDDAWTQHLRAYIDQLRADQLMPPITAVEVTGDEVNSTLVVTVSELPTKDVRRRIDAVLALVPYEIRHEPFLDDGSRHGVSYA